MSELRKHGEAVLRALGLEQYIGQRVVVHGVVVDPAEAFLEHPACGPYALPMIAQWDALPAGSAARAEATGMLRGVVAGLFEVPQPE